MKSILLFNNKGGVGKTTLTYSIANVLAKDSKVLIVDTDSQGSLSVMFNMDPEEGNPKTLANCINNIINEGEESICSYIQHTEFNNVDILVGGLDMEDGLNKVEQAYKDGDNVFMSIIFDIQDECDYDYVLFDSSPRLGTEVTAILYAVDYALIPTVVDRLALKGVEATYKRYNRINKARRGGLKFGIIRNIYEKDAAYTKKAEPEILTKYGDNVFEAVIPKSLKAPSSQVQGLNLNEERGYVKSLKEITKELIKRIG